MMLDTLPAAQTTSLPSRVDHPTTGITGTSHMPPTHTKHTHWSQATSMPQPSHLNCLFSSSLTHTPLVCSSAMASCFWLSCLVTQLTNPWAFPFFALPSESFITSIAQRAGYHWLLPVPRGMSLSNCPLNHSASFSL